MSFQVLVSGFYLKQYPRHRQEEPFSETFKLDAPSMTKALVEAQWQAMDKYPECRVTHAEITNRTRW